MTSVGIKNLYNLINIGVDHIQWTVNPDVEAKFMLKTFKKSGSTAIPMHFAIHNIATRIADKFNSLPDGIKKAIGIITVVVGGLGPLFLMTFGLLANAVANSVKGIQVLRKGYQQLSAGSSDAALKTQYLSQEELENISISNALYSKHQQLSAAYQLEAATLLL